SSLTLSGGMASRITVADRGAVTVGTSIAFLSGSTGSITVDGGTLTTSYLRDDAGTAPTIAVTDPPGGPALTTGSGYFYGPITDAAGGPGSVAMVGPGTLTLTGHL